MPQHRPHPHTPQHRHPHMLQHRHTPQHRPHPHMLQHRHTHPHPHMLQHRPHPHMLLLFLLMILDYAFVLRQRPSITPHRLNTPLPPLNTVHRHHHQHTQLLPHIN
ncbi:hypothetical protein BLA29_011982, partial [Euroglyphus maynei]